MKQPDINPFPFSDSNKRYHTYDYYVKKTFGRKCAKIPVDAGFTCPNIDGTKGTGGCIYCSGRGSGDFASPAELSVTEQIEKAGKSLREKWPGCGFTAYFQAHTNTYAPVDVLKSKFEEALLCRDVVAISIATRADVLTDEVCEYLANLSQRTSLTVELGLQSSSDETALYINRCMTTEEFEKGYEKLRLIPHLRIGVHIINGLPYESGEQMLKTAQYTSSLAPDEVKIHMLYILKGTKIEKLWQSEGFHILTREEFIDITTSQLTYLPPETVIGRLTGDAPLGQLSAPEWTVRKVDVLNGIDKKMFAENLTQGCFMRKVSS